MWGFAALGVGGLGVLNSFEGKVLFVFSIVFHILKGAHSFEGVFWVCFLAGIVMLAFPKGLCIT